jgi:hypothetical protein
LNQKVGKIINVILRNNESQGNILIATCIAHYFSFHSFLYHIQYPWQISGLFNWYFFLLAFLVLVYTFNHKEEINMVFLKEWKAFSHKKELVGYPSIPEYNY